MTDRRPDPDELLKHLGRTAEGRGRLKVFFGAAPGVGKTFAMLRAAVARQAAGADVVAGIVETHGRAETAALLAGLDVLPRQPLAYRGATLSEFDLDGALARRPELILVDELAHTNGPGSRHAKRWQDVEELLTAGIDVYSTMNVQHLESLNDVVARITGVKVTETVPDDVLDRADEIELVDVSPEVLIQRLADGKVYLPAQAERALRNFFRKGNLLALRELALRRTADRVDADVRGYRLQAGITDAWPASERIVACIGPGDGDGEVVRWARRMAEPIGAEWFALHVDAGHPGAAGSPVPEAAEALRLAERLGGTAVTVAGSRVADEIVDWVRRQNITRVVLGTGRTRSRWRRFAPSLLDTITARDTGATIAVVPRQREAPRQPPRRPATPAVSWLLPASVVTVVTGIALVSRELLSGADIAMLYLLGVVVVGARSRPAAAVGAAVASIALFDFLFVPPYYTFAVSDEAYVVTFGMMLGIGVVIARLTGRIREDTDRLRSRQRDTAAAFALSRDIARAPDAAAIVAAATGHLARAIDGDVEIILPDPDVPDREPDPVADWVLRNGRPAGAGTDTLPSQTSLYLPLATAAGTLGVIRLTAAPAALADPAIRPLLDNLANQTALGLERTQWSARSESARVEVEAERLRTNLLSSLSHDLRTPLAGIEGAASSLLAGSPPLEGPQAELAQTVVGEARRMNRLIGNLLDMVRVQSGSLAVHKEWQPVEEVVGIALLRLEERLAAHPVTTRIPPDLPLVPIDGLLIEQVLINLLENAARYAPPGSEILVAADLDDRAVIVTVADRGPGIPAGEEERIFDKFYRLASGGGGVGLGLAICRGILTAHRGRIWSEPREGGGARFRFSLPIEGAPAPEPEPGSGP